MWYKGKSLTYDDIQVIMHNSSSTKKTFLSLVNLKWSKKRICMVLNGTSSEHDVHLINYKWSLITSTKIRIYQIQTQVHTI